MNKGIAKTVLRAVDKSINFLLLIFLLLSFIYGSYSVWDANRLHVQASSFAYEEYRPTNDDRLGFEELREINPNVFGWITIYGTNIDYPLVQGTDNHRYVNTNASGEPSMSGAIFLDFRNDNSFIDFNNIIYGHDMSRDAMFGEISNFQYEDYFTERQFATIFTGHRDYGVEFFAFMLVDAHDFAFYNPNMTEVATKQQHIDRIFAEAKQYREIDVTSSDRLVVLSTCTETATNGRFVLIGRLTDNIEPDPFINPIAPTRGIDRLWRGIFDRPITVLDGIIASGVVVILAALTMLLLMKKSKGRANMNSIQKEDIGTEDSVKKKRKSPTLLREFMYLGVKIGAIMLISMLMLTFAFGLWQADDLSMIPAIQEGDLVFFNRMDRDYVATDTIVVQFEGQRQVRRVVAVAGDTVDITEDGLIINGRPQQELTIYEDTTQFVEGIDFPYVIPAGEMFILGDSRGRAVDSRVYGSVKIEDTLGSVVTIVRRRNL